MKALLHFAAALVLFASACGSPAAPVTAPTTPPPPLPANAPPKGAHPPQAANVEALKAALREEGYPQAQVSAYPDGRVTVVNLSPLTPLPTTKSAEETFTAFLAKHGDLLGFGALGPPTVRPAALRPPLVAILGQIRAESCPLFSFQAGFKELGDGERTPMQWLFVCPTMKDSADVFTKLQQSMARMSSAMEPPDPFASWLRSSEHMTVEPHDVVRTPGDVSATVSGPEIAPGNRVALVQAFAERAATVEKLPPLDRVDLEPSAPVHGDNRPLEERFTTLTLRLAKPPIDGPCIDPRVAVSLFDNAAVVRGGAPSMHIARVTVTCEHEPVSGNKPPSDIARRLPAAASGPLPFVMLCDYYNYAWGYQHSGTVVDRRGDVYSFYGGPVFSGTSASELATLVRHRKHYERTMAPADVDRLVALAPRIAHEPLVPTVVHGADMGGTGCVLFEPGASPDALVPVKLSESGQTKMDRKGPASAEANAILSRH